MTSIAGLPPSGERRFSSLARAFVALTRTRSLAHTATMSPTNDQYDPSTSAEFKGLQPLAYIPSYEVLDLISHTEHHSHESSTLYEKHRTFSIPWQPLLPQLLIPPLMIK